MKKKKTIWNGKTRIKKNERKIGMKESEHVMTRDTLCVVILSSSSALKKKKAGTTNNDLLTKSKNENRFSQETHESGH